MTPQEFVNKWANSPLGEKQIAQAHFLDVCRLVGVEMPADGKTEAGEEFVFEPSLKLRSGHGFADVYYENHFAIEYKTADKYKDLNAAYEQLLKYREKLNNPPLMAVTDFKRWEIHSNFPNTEKRVYNFSHSEIASSSEAWAWLRALFHAPQRLHPGRNTAQVTKEAADAFQLVADNMRDWNAAPTRIAYFLTKLVFCLFAEDVGLLPTMSGQPQGIFSYIIEHSRGKPSVFKQYVQNLFVAMNEGGNMFMRDIPYFNGALFKVVTVEELKQEALDELATAAKLNWASIEPSIFGTLFERSLDPNKRSQRGAHYTSREDILLIVEPVLMQPLRYAWDTVQLEAAPIRERYDNARTGRAKTNARSQLLAKRDEILARVRGTTVLDPACGSGNFLYVSLQLLMDLEKEIIYHPLWAGLQLAARQVHPRQMYGIEIDPIAQALASIVVWIGYIQWRINNGYGQEFAEPILEELEDNIVCRDAILPPAQPPARPHPAPTRCARPANDDRRGDLSNRPPVTDSRGGRHGMSPLQSATTPDWPAVDVIVGNPPFLGEKKMRSELGDNYVNSLRSFYVGRIPGDADLATYWFENAREQIEKRSAKRAGLLATNSIRGGANREVLKRIKASGDIFMAWSDRDWILDGAAVRVSMIGFDDATEQRRTLDGLPAENINPDLTSSVDITVASSIGSNRSLSFQGPGKVGDFDIPNDIAQEMLAVPSNREVIKRYITGVDILRGDRGYWLIDFRALSEEEAGVYRLPFQYVVERCKPFRLRNRNSVRKRFWWRLGASGEKYRTAVANCKRQIFTSQVAKHRIFCWYPIDYMPANTVIAIARDDDYFFGVLHSKLHEIWSLRMGTSLEDRPRYTPTTTFETFPFPWSPGREDESDPAHARISAAAKQLHEERHAWLNPHPAEKDGRGDSVSRPPAARPEAALKDRTLTNLYNALQVWRGLDNIKTKPAAADFAPRLDQLHRELDEAVCDAYGWEYDILADEEEMLRRLLALNLERAASQ